MSTHIREVNVDRAISMEADVILDLDSGNHIKDKTGLTKEYNIFRHDNKLYFVKKNIAVEL